MSAFKNRSEVAYYLPFLVFIALMMAGEAAGALFKTKDNQYWVYPAQTLICGALLFFHWRHYGFGAKLRKMPNWTLAAAVGIFAFLLWIAPQVIFLAAPRTEGFDPAHFAGEGWPYWLNLSFRFLRLVLVVPLLEELFWRGFLMRWLIREEFTKIAIGTFQRKAFALVALFFMFEHQPVDYPAAFLTGLLYNLVAVRTQSLGACILAHSITNFLLGCFVMNSGQFGFW